jgi:type IV pilus assembly protein PilY1
LYTALAPSGNPQPITSKPAIVTHPDAGFILLFGTGRFFVSGDDILSADPEVDTFYGIWDNNITVASVGARDLPSGTQPETILQPQAIIEEDTELFGTEERFTRTLSNNAVEYTTPPIQFGWYLDLVSPVNGKQGERVIADPVLTISEGNSPLIVFNTFAPTGGCETAGGFSALMALDPINGGRTNFAVFDLNGDDAFTADDADSGSGAHDSGLITESTIAPVALISSTDGTVTYALTAALSGQTNVTAIQGSALNLGRQSWRELQ